MEKFYELLALIPEHIGWMIVNFMVMICIRALIDLGFFIYEAIKENREEDEE